MIKLNNISLGYDNNIVITYLDGSINETLYSESKEIEILNLMLKQAEQRKDGSSRHYPLC